MTLRVGICAALALLSSALCFGADARRGYTEWVNYRFQYQFDLPSHGLTPGNEPTNGDGRVFTSKDGRFTVTVWGSNNALSHTVAQECSSEIQSIAAHPIVRYRRVAKNWFVISGTSGRKTFYEKAIFHDGQFDAVQIWYPSREARRYDTIAAHISRSFRYVPHVWEVNGQHLAGTDPLGR